MAMQHVLIRFLGFGEGECLNHTIHISHLGESNSFFRVQRVPRWPACNGEASGYEGSGGCRYVTANYAQALVKCIDMVAIRIERLQLQCTEYPGVDVLCRNACLGRPYCAALLFLRIQ